jgi:hypothetical protein
MKIFIDFDKTQNHELKAFILKYLNFRHFLGISPSPHSLSHSRIVVLEITSLETFFKEDEGLPIS